MRFLRRGEPTEPETHPCAVCPRAVHVGERHVAVVWQVERKHGDETEVLDSEPISFMHLGCAQSMRAVSEGAATGGAL